MRAQELCQSVDGCPEPPSLITTLKKTERGRKGEGQGGGGGGVEKGLRGVGGGGGGGGGNEVDKSAFRGRCGWKANDL